MWTAIAARRLLKQCTAATRTDLCRLTDHQLHKRQPAKARFVLNCSTPRQPATTRLSLRNHNNDGCLIRLQNRFGYRTEVKRTKPIRLSDWLNKDHERDDSDHRGNERQRSCEVISALSCLARIGALERKFENETTFGYRTNWTKTTKEVILLSSWQQEKETFQFPLFATRKRPRKRKKKICFGFSSIATRKRQHSVIESTKRRRNWYDTNIGEAWHICPWEIGWWAILNFGDASDHLIGWK